MGKAGFKAACDDMFADGAVDGCDDDDDDDDDGNDNVVDDLGCNVYRSVHACFEWLPFACVVEDRYVVQGCGFGLGSWCADV